jgi:hypothetical protein
MLPFNGAQGVEVYADVAFNVINGSEARKVYAQNVKKIQGLGLARRVLFGSDWWNYLYDCDDEVAYLKQLDVDGDWWTSADFVAAETAFLAGVQ